MSTKILFVCLGNICRSPAAEGILHNLIGKYGLTDSLEADSAGTYGGHAGQPSDERMRKAALQRGYTLTHRARQFRVEDFERFDMIVVMDDMNYEDAHRLAPSPDEARKIFRMAEFCPRSGFSYVPDPYYEGREGFELVLDMLEEGCARIVKYVRNQSRS